MISVDDRDRDSDDDFDTSGRLIGTLTENSVPHLSPEKSPLDLSEARKLEQFIEETCKCKLGPQKAACSTLFSQSDICTYRSNCLELLPNELDLMVLGQTASCLKESDSTGRLNTQFAHKGQRICQKTFQFLHSISHHRYENLCRHYACNGLTPHRHGNSGRSPANTLSFAETNGVISFLRNFAIVHALPLPG